MEIKELQKEIDELMGKMLEVPDEEGSLKEAIELYNKMLNDMIQVKLEQMRSLINGDS